VLWDKKGEVRLGRVFTDVTPRKHARARICDQNDTHFASVRAACSTNPEISTNVRFKIVPTFSELSVKACGSIISGKTCSSSFQVLPSSHAHVHVHTHAYAYAHAHAHTRAHAHAQAQAHAHAHAHAHTHTHTHTYTRVYECMRVWLCVCACAHAKLKLRAFVLRGYSLRFSGACAGVGKTARFGRGQGERRERCVIAGYGLRYGVGFRRPRRAPRAVLD